MSARHDWAGQRDQRHREALMRRRAGPAVWSSWAWLLRYWREAWPVQNRLSSTASPPREVENLEAFFDAIDDGRGLP